MKTTDLRIIFSLFYNFIAWHAAAIKKSAWKKKKSTRK